MILKVNKAVLCSFQNWQACVLLPLGRTTVYNMNLNAKLSLYSMISRVDKSFQYCFQGEQAYTVYFFRWKILLSMTYIV